MIDKTPVAGIAAPGVKLLSLLEGVMDLRGAWNTVRRALDAMREAAIIVDLMRRAEDEYTPPPDVDLGTLSDAALIARFKMLAIEETQAPGVDAIMQVTLQIEQVLRELEGRPGAPHDSLFKLYHHRDIRIRYRAAESTRAYDFELATDRMHHIDDEDWQPPSECAAPRPTRLSRLTTAALVAQFRSIALQQERASDHYQILLYNRLYGTMAGIVRTLDERHARRNLEPLLKDRNLHVRLKAAVHLRSIAPDTARPVLEAIRNSLRAPHCYEATSALGQRTHPTNQRVGG
jgi:hypothetical protein